MNVFSSPLALIVHVLRAISFQHDGRDLPKKPDFDLFTLAALAIAAGLVRWSLLAHEGNAVDIAMVYSLTTSLLCLMAPGRCARLYLLGIGIDLVGSGLWLLGVDTTVGLPFWLLIAWNSAAMFITVRVQRKTRPANQSKSKE